MYTYNHWISKTEKPTTAKAFTYTIFFPETNHRYIGYKTINKKDSWLTYKSSSRPVKKLINEGHIAIYSIVNWFNNAEDARAEEVLLMTIHQVTKRPEFLNQCISGVKFGTAGKSLSAEHRAKIRESNKGKTRSEETRTNMKEAHKGKTISNETRARIGTSKQIGLYVTPLGTFNTLKEASIAHNCSIPTISNRCNSTSPKFKDWYFQPK